MIIFKCKMCGGNLSFEPGESVAECPYCGTTQTLPKLDNDRRANLYDRANHFRRQNEYDKAAAIYEQILAEDRIDAEAYWSLVLCKYGIEYVKDPVSHRHVPTVNRVQYVSILADEDYKAALRYADAKQRDIYKAEAASIAEIQKGILEISSKEEPFDIFICYKETDENGRRTPDSALANDIYHQLTNEGFKVFFSRITLEEKLGYQYEPYIFAALNSAQVMLVIGTKAEHFNAVWVKNEWSRFLSLMREDHTRLLIPCYRDMNPYDLPEEFSSLQSQDMNRIGFMQDIIHGVKKVLSDSSDNKVSSSVNLNDKLLADALIQALGDHISKYESRINEKQEKAAIIRNQITKKRGLFRHVSRKSDEEQLSFLQKEIENLNKRRKVIQDICGIVSRYPNNQEKWIDYLMNFKAEIASPILDSSQMKAIQKHEKELITIKAKEERKAAEQRMQNVGTILLTIGLIVFFIIALVRGYLN